MPVNLANFEVWTPKSGSSAVIDISVSSPNWLTPESKGGALIFKHHSPGGMYINHIFSPIGYFRCILRGNGYQVLPTFDATKPDMTTLQASFVGISDEDGTAMFENLDSNGSRWPVAFVPSTAYVWIRYAGPVTP